MVSILAGVGMGVAAAVAAVEGGYLAGLGFALLDAAFAAEVTQPEAYAAPWLFAGLGLFFLLYASVPTIY